MKLTNLVVVLALISSGASHAASGIFESYGILKINASTDTYYDMQATTGNPDLNGASLGTFDLTQIVSLTLRGGEVKTFKNGISDVFSAALSYRVVKDGDTPGSFASINLPFDSNIGGGGDQKWDETAATVDLLSGLGNGNYTLEVFASANSSDGTHFSNNGGNNYKATFTVVPEPSSALLGLLGAGLLLRRRRA
ncbi:PEP-CTERM sorting domain-containing protein [Akkermansiaceae bacterium]|nr:PEP-CTERM sorting domain-containing protein [Akkermansiaceae bacterium]